MTPPAPTLHTFDPLIAGKVGLYIDAPGVTYDQVNFKVGSAHGGPYYNLAPLTKQTHNDALYLICDADQGTTQYYIAQLHDSTGYSAISNEVSAAGSAGPPAPPPPPTQQQDLAAAIGQAVNPGDQVAVYPAPSVVKTVNADGSIS